MTTRGSLPGRVGSIFVRNLRRKYEAVSPMADPTMASWIPFLRNNQRRSAGRALSARRTARLTEKILHRDDQLQCRPG